jgi:hypothetical protein
MKRALAVGAVLALALAIACQIPDRHFQVRDGGSADAVIDAMHDAMIDAKLGPCDLTAPWGTPTPVAGLSQLGSIARLTGDELEAYFSLKIVVGTITTGQLFVATRPDVASAFGSAVELTGVNGSDGMATPTISNDGSTLFYTWGQAPLHSATGSDRDIYRATRTGSASEFGSGARVSFSIANYPEDYAYVGWDGDVWFAAERGSESVLEIYVAPSVGGASFGSAVERGELSSISASNNDPLISYDQLHAYFQRAGMIFTADRTSVGSAFSTPYLVPELETGSGYCVGMYCRPSWMSNDGCRLYIGVGPAGGNIDIYVMSKPPNP